MRDKYSGEVARTLYPLGFYKKFTDAGWRDKTAGTMNAQEDPGLADGVFISRGGQAAFIECKTGGRTAFAFDGWVQQQREFAVACAFMNIPYWMFLIMGVTIKDKQYPRVAYLFTGQKLFDIIEMATPRKSLAYATAASLLLEDQLQWAGSSTWEIPEGHAFRNGLLNRNSASRSDSQADSDPPLEYQALAQAYLRYQHMVSPPARYAITSAYLGAGNPAHRSLWQPGDTDFILPTA